MSGTTKIKLDKNLIYQDKPGVNLGLTGPLVAHILMLLTMNWHDVNYIVLLTVPSLHSSTYLQVGKNFGSFGFQFSPLQRDLLISIQCNRYGRRSD